MYKILLDFEIQANHLIPTRRPDLELIKQDKIICRLVYFVVSADHRMKIKESKNINKYSDLARELKKHWNKK